MHSNVVCIPLSRPVIHRKFALLEIIFTDLVPAFQYFHLYTSRVQKSDCWLFIMIIYASSIKWI